MAKYSSDNATDPQLAKEMEKILHVNHLLTSTVSLISAT